MRIFVTGASGHIGSALVPELIAGGHEVVGLVRSDRSAATLEAAGAEVRRGDLDDTDGLAEATGAADGVIHLAYRHDALRAGEADAAMGSDAAAIAAIGDALAGSDKPFVGTSGTLLVTGLGRVATEEDTAEGAGRVAAENAVVALADRGVRSAVVRLAPVVHSSRDEHGFVPTLIGIAREQGVAAYVGDGENRWPAVHTLDAARLYRLAVENAAPGTRLSGAAEEGIPLREIAAAIAHGLGLPSASVSAEKLGSMASFATLDDPSSSALTRQWLGWSPTEPGLIADLGAGHYFA